MATEAALTELLRESGYEASLITTFNLYPPFYEELLLPRLRSAGCRYNVVLADARQCHAAAVASESRPRHAGTDYVLCPVRSSAAFHPKIIMLVGRTKAALAVGSHNLTLSGFGYNRELTTCIRFKPSDDSDAVRGARRLWKGVKDWISKQSDVPGDVREAVLAFRNHASWLDADPGKSEKTKLDFLTQTPQSPSLWSQVNGSIPKKVRRVIVLGAFFDDRLAFLTTISRARPGVPVVAGIEPATVEIAKEALDAGSVDFRDASGIHRGTGYLHAKAVLFETGGADDVLLLGSANPSAPAWLGGESGGNGEAVVLHRGASAHSIAKDLGLLEIPGMPKLTRADRKLIVERRESESPRNEHGRVFVATMIDTELKIPSSALKGISPSRIRLLGTRDEVLMDTKASVVRGETLVVPVPPDVSARALFVVIQQVRGADCMGFIHRTSEIKDLSQTTKQSQLRAALTELGSDTADLGRLIATIEKVIFEEPEIVVTPRGGGGGKKGGKDRVQPERPDSLATSMEAEKARRHRKILEHGDLAYLFAALFRQVGVGLERRGTGTGADEKGRTEEEQVGQDDEEEGEEKKKPNEPDLKTVDDPELARMCRSKVSRLISRMGRQMEQAARKRSGSPTVLLQLVAVLALLRELRATERMPRWIRIHESLAATEDLERLLDEVLAYLFGRKYRLYEAIVTAMGDERYEELARLKGLLIWLAWECRVTLDNRLSIREDTEDVQSRIYDKAALLEFALMLKGDELARSEAAASVLRVSTGGTAAAASAWLAKYEKWSDQISSLLEHKTPAPNPADVFSAGDLAVVTTQQPLRLRVVGQVAPGQISLVDFGEENLYMRFLRDRVARVGV